MTMIQHYTVVEVFKNYDKILNKDNLSISELLPTSVSWVSDGKTIEIKDNNKIIPLLLSSGNEVAIIIAPFDIKNNKAFIVNAAGNIKWNVKSLIDEKLNDAIFSDVYYISKDLFFFVNISGSDYRFLFNLETGICGELLKSY